MHRHFICSSFAILAVCWGVMALAAAPLSKEPETEDKFHTPSPCELDSKVVESTPAACDLGESTLLAVPASWGPTELDPLADCVEVLAGAEAAELDWWPTDPSYCVDLVAQAVAAVDDKFSGYTSIDDYVWDDLGMYVPSDASVDWECQSSSGSTHGVCSGSNFAVAVCIRDQLRACQGAGGGLMLTNLVE